MILHLQYLDIQIHDSPLVVIGWIYDSPLLVIGWIYDSPLVVIGWIYDSHLVVIGCIYDSLPANNMARLLNNVIIG